MNEAEFAFRIRQALNEGADTVSYKASMRLERARQLAVGRARSAAVAARPATVRLPALQLATSGGAPLDAPGGHDFWAWLRGAGLLAPLLALVVGFVAIYQWHNRQFITELADVDFAVLLDETPISAYADKGFGAMLARRPLPPASDLLQSVHGEPHAETVTDPAADEPPGADPAGPGAEASATPSSSR
jgi:hypothetical protein